MRYERVVVGPLEVNCYLVYDEETKEGIIIDPGGDPEVIKRKVESIGMKPVAIVNTHTHVDHIGANADMKEAYPEAELVVPEKDLPLFQSPKNPMLVMMCRAKQSPEPDRTVKEGDEILFGSERLRVVETPGHTIGSVCLYSEEAGLLFTGDTLFAGSIGRTDLPFSSERDLFESVPKKIFVLPEDVKVLPGHGPTSTVGSEKRFNPFFSGTMII